MLSRKDADANFTGLCFFAGSRTTWPQCVNDHMTLINIRHWTMLASSISASDLGRQYSTDCPKQSHKPRLNIGLHSDNIRDRWKDATTVDSCNLIGNGHDISPFNMNDVFISYKLWALGDYPMWFVSEHFHAHESVYVSLLAYWSPTKA